MYMYIYIYIYIYYPVQHFSPIEGVAGAGAYPGIIIVKQPREHLLSLEQDANLLQGTVPQNVIGKLSYIQVPI